MARNRRSRHRQRAQAPAQAPAAYSTARELGADALDRKRGL